MHWREGGAKTCHALTIGIEAAVNAYFDAARENIFSSSQSCCVLEPIQRQSAKLPALDAG